MELAIVILLRGTNIFFFLIIVLLLLSSLSISLNDSSVVVIIEKSVENNREKLKEIKEFCYDQGILVSQDVSHVYLGWEFSKI